MKISRFILLFVLCLSCFSCAKKPEKQELQAFGQVNYENYAISISPTHWTQIADDSFSQMKKLQDDANEKLPLSFIIKMSYQGKNAELLHIGNLETKDGNVPSIKDIDDYFKFLSAKVKTTNQVVMDSGKQDTLKFWVMRIKMPEFYSIKMVYYADKSTTPLFLDFYVSTKEFTKLVSVEFDKLISSVTLRK